MRIIAGSLRGRQIKTPEDPGLRPISGRIKQSLFDMLTPRLPGARLLDLFAGTGAVGIEALSRGASFVFFVERNRRVLAILGENLKALGLESRARAQPGDALEDLSWIPFRAGVETFDIIFLGPPYKDVDKRPLAYSTPVLARVVEARLLAPGGVVVLQHQVKEEVALPPGLECARQVKYGDTYLDFLKAAA